MKRLPVLLILFLFLCLLIPLSSFAQDSAYPDTVALSTGKVYPCYVTDMQNSVVRLIYGKGNRSVVGLDGVDKIILKENGIVYQSGKFVMDYDSIKAFLSRREAEGLSKQYQKAIPEQEDTTIQKIHTIEHRWSFGVVYIPYYSGKIYRYYFESYYPNQPYFYSYSENITMLEGEFSFAIDSNVRLTLDIGYTKTYSREKLENHLRSNDPGYNYDSGIVETSDLKLFDFTLGLKYHLKRLMNQKVSACFLGGLGKQLAFASGGSEVLYQQEPPTTTSEDNRNEYLEDLNSPWHLNLGFGTEYSFNASLSLFANIRFYYSKISAKYDFRETDEYQTRTGSLETDDSEIVTRIGLGINFYF